MSAMKRYETGRVGSDFGLRNGNILAICHEGGRVHEDRIEKRKEVGERVRVKVLEHGCVDIV